MTWINMFRNFKGKKKTYGMNRWIILSENRNYEKEPNGNCKIQKYTITTITHRMDLTAD